MNTIKTDLKIFSHLTKSYARQAMQRKFDTSCLSKAANETSPFTNASILVTGGTTGIGLETVKALTKLPISQLIFTSRDLNKAEKIRKQLIQQAPGLDIQAWKLDLADFESVQDFGRRWQESEMELDILINNAGQLDLSFPKLTKNGYESHLQVNHLSPFMLTKLLLPSLRQSSSKTARIISVNSSLHQTAHLDPFNLNNQHNSILAYANSKLLQLICVSELNKVLGDWHTSDKRSVKAVAVSPGFVKSEIGNSSTVPLWTQALLFPAKMLFAREASCGAACIVDAVERDVQGIHAYFDQMQVGILHPLVKNRAVRRLVWDFSLKVARDAERGYFQVEDAQEHLESFKEAYSRLNSKDAKVLPNLLDWFELDMVKPRLPRVQTVTERTWMDSTPWLK